MYSSHRNVHFLQKIAVSDWCPNLLNALTGVKIYSTHLMTFSKWYRPFLRGGLCCHTHDQIHRYHYHHPNFHCTTQSMVMSYLSQSTRSNITRSANNNNSSSPSSFAVSAVGVVPPAIPNSVKGAVGAAAFLQVCVTQAAAIATATANDAAAVNSAHNIII